MLYVPVLFISDTSGHLGIKLFLLLLGMCPWVLSLCETIRWVFGILYRGGVSVGSLLP